MDYRQQIVHADGDGGIIIETKQDVTQILESNNQIREADKARLGHVNEFHHIARIPFTVIDDLNKRGVMRGFTIIDDVAFARWLNDSDNAQWKVYRGNI
jgi:hypothetical protein